MFWLTLLACKGVDPAPRDLDALFHYLFEHIEEGSDEQLHDALVGFDEEAGPARGFEVFDGTVTHLSEAEIAPLGVDRDPSKAPGVFLVNDVACGWKLHKRLLVYPRQDEFHSTYSIYERTYHEDWEAWADGDIDFVSWELDYEVKSFIVDYAAHTVGSLRRVKALDDARSPFGEVIVGLTYLPEPATFDNDNKNMLQDYHLEAFWKRNGVVMHAYALWRQADWGTGFTTEDDSIQRVALNALQNWDDDNEKACRDGF